MAVATPVKPVSIAVLHKRLTTCFNMYIRLRDTRDGWGTCISCLKPKQFEELDAGHYVAASYAIHRYDEKNVNSQCKSCNRFLHGNLIGYTLGMERKYGFSIPRSLELTKHQPRKYSREELEEKIVYYKGIVKQMKGELAHAA